MKPYLLLFFLFSLQLISAPVEADDWPQFRGPNGAGTSDEKGLPVRWSATSNIDWKTDLPGPGSSSPIIIGNRIYVSCYTGYGTSREKPGNAKSLRRHLICLNRTTGRVVWNKPVSHHPEDQHYTGFLHEHGYASSTPTSDGRNIYAYFGICGAYAFDTNGRELWHADCGSRQHGFGSGASPVLHEDLLIVNASVESGALIAFDKRTGREVWRAEGIVDAWNTPVLVKSSRRRELVLATRNGVLAFDPSTGRPLWNWKGTDRVSYVCPSLVVHNKLLYGMSSYYGPLVAIRSGGQGNVTATHTAWKYTRFHTTVVSPVHHNGHLYYPHDNEGTMACFDIRNGNEKNRVRPHPNWGNLYASPLAASGKLFVVTRYKGTYVFNANPEMSQIAHNIIEGDNTQFNASPVPHNRQLLLRSEKALYCIGKMQ